MKALFMSGGATKFISLISAAQELKLRYGYEASLICGVSSGSIAALLAATDQYDKGIDLGINLTLDTIFDKKPVTKTGKLTLGAIWRAVSGKNYLGCMGNLEKNMKAVVTQEIFEEYKRNPNSPEVGVLAVNASTKARKMWFLKDCDYETAIKAVMASSTIPAVAPAVEIDGEFYYDGGVRDHSPGPYVLEHSRFKNGITKVVSIYSRPEDYVLPESNEWRKNLIKLINLMVIPTMNIEISKNDEYVERVLSKHHSIELNHIFINFFAESLFDVSRENMNKGYREGMKAVREQYEL